MAYAVDLRKFIRLEDRTDHRAVAIHGHGQFGVIDDLDAFWKMVEAGRVESHADFNELHAQVSKHERSIAALTALIAKLQRTIRMYEESLAMIERGPKPVAPPEPLPEPHVRVSDK